MSPREWVTLSLTAAGAFFFFAGTVAILRFPDVYARRHGVTKADNLGLGLVVLGLMVHVDGWMVRLELLVIWAVALLASATGCNLIAETALRARVPVRKG